MRLLALAVLVSLSCATAKPSMAVKFVDDSESSAPGWVCLFAVDDTEHKQLLCLDLKAFLEKYGTAENRHTSEL